MGILCYGAALFPLHLAEADPTCQLLQPIQTRINDIARLLLGVSRADHMPVEVLLSRTGLPSFNRRAVHSTIVELWKSLHSCDNGERNPLGTFLSTPPNPPSNRLTRAAAAGDLPPPLLKKDNVFVWNAVKIFNDLPPPSARHYLWRLCISWPHPTPVPSPSDADIAVLIYLF